MFLKKEKTCREASIVSLHNELNNSKKISKESVGQKKTN